MPYLIRILFFCMGMPVLMAQQENLLEVKGIVLDAHTKKPLPFATLSLGKKHSGTVTNEDGLFVLKIAREDLPDTMRASYIGYGSVGVYLSVATLAQPVTLRLEQTVVSLNEITITALNPTSLLKEAMAALPNNYETKPVMMKEFYRESILQNDSLISLAEAILSVYKASYTDPTQKDQMQLLKGRKSQHLQSDLPKNFFIAGGLQVDFVKMNFQPLVEQNFGLYDYHLQELVTDDKDTLYVIAFDQKDGIKMPLLKGKIYIDMRSLAFTGMEYGYSPKGIAYANQRSKEQEKQMKKEDFRVKIVQSHTKVHFKRYGTIWYLNHAESVFHLQTVREKGKRTDNLTYRADLSVTDIEKKNVQPIPKEDQLLNVGVDLGRQIGKDYDQKFWENYNYTVPPADIQKKAKQMLSK